MSKIQILDTQNNCSVQKSIKVWTQKSVTPFVQIYLSCVPFDFQINFVLIGLLVELKRGRTFFSFFFWHNCCVQKSQACKFVYLSSRSYSRLLVPCTHWFSMLKKKFVARVTSFCQYRQIRETYKCMHSWLTQRGVKSSKKEGKSMPKYTKAYHQFGAIVGAK